MVLREVEAKEFCSVAQFGQIEPLGELPRDPDPSIVHMIEDAKSER
jgi:hypothetical protein